LVAVAAAAAAVVVIVGALVLRRADSSGVRVTAATPSSTPSLPKTAPPNQIALTVATPTFGPGLQAADIGLVNSDGTDLVQLTHTNMNGMVASQPSWSPDRQRLAFVESTPAGAINAGAGNVVLINADGSNRVALTHSAADTHPVWAPDGHHLAFARFDNGLPDIFVIGDDGSGLTRLTHGGAMSPTWSPDGDALAYRNLPGGVIDGGHIFVINADGTNPRQLTNGLEEGSPAWSPDGTRIAFANTADYSIYTIRPDGTLPTRITTCTLPSCTGHTSPAWSPDSLQLVFDQNDGYARKPYIVSSTEGQPHLLANLENEICCTAWS
jgi:Tol biopolymer transport system component